MKCNVRGVYRCGEWFRLISLCYDISVWRYIGFYPRYEECPTFVHTQQNRGLFSREQSAESDTKIPYDLYTQTASHHYPNLSGIFSNKRMQTRLDHEIDIQCQTSYILQTVATQAA